MAPFMVEPAARHGHLGTGADFTELFPMDFRRLGTGADFTKMFPMKFDAMKPDWAQTAGFNDLFPMIAGRNRIYFCEVGRCAQSETDRGEQFL